MKMYIRRAFTFTRQGGPASTAETTQSAGRRIESGYFSLDHGIGLTSEYDENGDGRTAMLAAALTMAPRNPLWFTSGDKSHGPAKTPALSLVNHLGIPPSRRFNPCLNPKVTGLPLGKTVFEPRTVRTHAAARRNRLRTANAIGLGVHSNPWPSLDDLQPGTAMIRLYRLPVISRFGRVIEGSVPSGG